MLRTELLQAVRRLGRRLPFVALVSATLGLGIGANAVVFSVIDAVLLEPLPYADAEELVVLRNRSRQEGAIRGASWPEAQAWEEAGAGAFSDLATSIDRPFNVTGGDEPVQVWGSQVTRGFFETLGTPAALGRAGPLAEDGQLVVSHEFWRRHLGSDPAAVGRVLRLDDEPFELVGVMPPGFRSPGEPVELWVSLEPMRARLPRDPGLKFFSVVGRLRPGVSPEAAEARLAPVGRRMEREHPEANAGLEPVLVPMRDQLVGEARPALLVLFAAAGLVLLLACLNVANLLLARARARRRELAVRQVLGAGTPHLFRQLLAEGAVLAAGGGAVGCVLAVAGVGAVRRLLPPDLLPAGAEVGLDARVLLFVGALVGGTALAFGLVPLLRGFRTSPSVDLRESRGDRGGGAEVGRRVRSALVVGQIGIALLLLIGASLLIGSYARLQDVDPGFRTDGVLSLYLLLPESRYAGLEEQRAFLDGARREIGRIPGVRGTGVVTHLPISGNDIVERFTIPGRPPLPGESRQAAYRGVWGRYFEVLDVPVVAGRPLERADQEAGRRVALINETMARRFWPDESPLGRRIGLEGLAPETEGFGELAEHEIVGVVGDVRHRSLETAPQSEVYVPYPSMPWSVFYVVVRTDGPALGVADQVREAIWAVDPDLPIADLRTLSQRVRESVARPRFSSALLGAFSAIALGLAAVGIYGLVAYTVGERTHEIGVRMAVGAERRDILRLVMGDGARLAGLGVALGLVASVVSTRFLSSLLFEVEAIEPLRFLVVSAALAAAVLLASWLPARRAARVDPMAVLRRE